MNTHVKNCLPFCMKVQKRIVIGLLSVLFFLFISKPVQAAPSFQQVGNTLVMSNVNVRLEYNLNAGTTDFYWQNSKKDFPRSTAGLL